MFICDVTMIQTGGRLKVPSFPVSSNTDRTKQDLLLTASCFNRTLAGRAFSCHRDYRLTTLLPLGRFSWCSVDSADSAERVL